MPFTHIPQFQAAYNNLSTDIHSKLWAYKESLHAQYNEPQLRAMQAQAREQERAEEAFIITKKQEEESTHEYASKREKIRKAHSKRLQTRDKPPE